jgi:hypothetical protein
MRRQPGPDCALAIKLSRLTVNRCAARRFPKCASSCWDRAEPR